MSDDKKEEGFWKSLWLDIKPFVILLGILAAFGLLLLFIEAATTYFGGG